jgi:hypothetical protein
MYNGQTYLFTPKPFLATLISKTDREITIRSGVGKKDVSIKTDSLFKNYEVSNEPLKRIGAVEIDLSNLPSETQAAIDEMDMGNDSYQGKQLQRLDAVDHSYKYDDDSSRKKRSRGSEGGKRSRKSRKSKKSRRSRRSRK